MAQSLEALKIAFCDEDTATWTKAARALGERAATDAEARAFLLAWLTQEDNVHRFRHACCALASRMSCEAEPDEELERLQAQQIVTPLVELALGSLPPDATIADLSKIPGAADRFASWADKQSDKLRGLIDRFESTGKTKAADANKKKLAQIEGSGPSSPVPSDFTPSQPKLTEWSVWAVASYFAGVRHPRALGSLPLDLVVDALLDLGASRKAAGLPLVLGLPPMLERLDGTLDAALRARLVDKLESTLPESWAGDRLHYNDYVRHVASLRREASFRALWTGKRKLPAWLDAAFDEIVELAKEGRTTDANRRSAVLMRDIAERCFGDDWRWQELGDGARFALNAFALLAIHGPAPLVKRKVEPLRLSHRIALVVDAIRQGQGAREQVLPTLVRCLKLLLDTELKQHAKKSTLSAICRRQIVIVQPLVAEWRLPGTLRKDLATIVCRVLLAAYRNDRAGFLELLYAVLYALPDQVLFREMVEYSTEDEVSAMLTGIVAGIDHWHEGGSVENAWAHYTHYVELLTQSCGEHAPWSEHLVGLMRLLSRHAMTSEYSANEIGATYDTLRNVLRARQIVRKTSEDAVDRRSDKKGANWAARELERQIDHETRAVFDRFQRVLDDIQILESDCLPEVGHPTPSDDLVRRWRRMISALDDLGRLCADELPYVEREMSTHLIKTRVAKLEARLFVLMQVLEKEDEGVAVDLLEKRVAGAKSADAASDLAAEDGNLVQEWMLGRYMVRELARTLRLRVLVLLTSPTFVAFWVLSPFVACSVLHLLQLYRWRGLPFAVATVANLVLVLLYFMESRRARAVTAGTGRFLLPQITAALFLGINEVLASDEAWSLAVLEFPWVRGFTILAFLLAGFFFTREVLLGGQLKSKADTRKKSRRAANVMSLVLWQSFVLVVLFALISGRVMGDRAELDVEHLNRLAAQWGHFLPHEVHLGSFFLEPVEENALYPSRPSYRVFPWAVLTWTVQVFFFSAIFERIMRGKD
ncbi:MAG: hypothetical protein RMA76_02740 [Deltaproteobacteria bacterium]